MAPRAALAALLEKHGGELVHCRTDGSVLHPISLPPNPAQEAGLGCTVCAAACAAGVITASKWTRFEYGTGVSKPQIQDVKCHCNVAAQQRQGKRRLDGHHSTACDWGQLRPLHCEATTEPPAGSALPQPSDLAPSREHVTIAIELVHSWGGCTAADFARRCESARRAGGHVPHCHSSHEAFRKIVTAAAQVEFEHDRTVLIPSLLECSWAQDKADDTLLCKYRGVTADWAVHERVIGAFEPTGDRAVQGARDMATALASLCTAPGEAEPDAAAMATFVRCCRNATADGAAAEQLSLRIAKSDGTLPNLTFITRAEEHTANLVMERAIKKCGFIEHLLQRLLTGQTTRAGSGKTPGGLARFLTDSPKLARRFKAQQQIAAGAARALEAALGAGPASAAPGSDVRFCMPRFDSLVDPLRSLLSQIGVVVAVLAEEAEDPTGFRDWARDLLNTAANYEALMTLGLVTDILIAARGWVHARDQKARGRFESICVSRRLNSAFVDEITALVEGDAPLALSKHYALGIGRGVYDTLRTPLALHGVRGLRTPIIAVPGDWREKMEPLIHCRELVLWAKKYVLLLFPGDSLQEALSPFDLRRWNHCGEEAERDVVRRTLAPLAACRGADLDLATGGYLALRHGADAQRKAGAKLVPEYWRPVLRIRKATAEFPDFARIALPMMAQFEGNGALEGDFSRIARQGAKKRQCGQDHCQDIAKVLIDGPKPIELNDEWLGKVQSMYCRLFGGRVTAHWEKTRSDAAYVDPRTGQKRPHCHKGQTEVERKRRKLLADAAALAPTAADRQCVLGAAPSADEALHAALEPERRIAASKHAPVYDALVLTGERQGQKLATDRDPGTPGGAALRKSVANAHLREAEITAAIASVQAGNLDPMRDAALGQWMTGVKAARPGAPAPKFLFYSAALAPNCPNPARALLEELGHNVTSKFMKALMTPCDAGYVEDLLQALRGPRSFETWALRLLGCQVVDGSWISAVGKFRRLPLPLITFRGMRRPHVRLAIHPTFAKEHDDVALMVEQCLRQLPGALKQWALFAGGDGKAPKCTVVTLMSSGEKARRAAATAEATAGAASSSSSRPAAVAAHPAARSAKAVDWDADDLWAEVSALERRR